MNLASIRAIFVLSALTAGAAAARADSCSADGDPGCTITCDGPAMCVDGLQGGPGTGGTPATCYCSWGH